MRGGGGEGGEVDGGVSVGVGEAGDGDGVPRRRRGVRVML
jgi:hypothetical protein